MTKKLLVSMISLILLIGTTGGLYAYTVDLTFIKVENPVSVQRTIDGSQVTTNAGLFHFTRTGGDFPVTYTDLYTFCVEPLEYTSYSLVTYDVVALSNAPTNVPGGMGSVKADLLRELYGVYFPNNTSKIGQNEAAALQIATWEIVRETSVFPLNVYDGNVHFNTSDAANLANTYLGYISSNVGPMRNDIYAATKVGNQDPWLPGPPVPEPLTMILYGLGFVGAEAYRRSRKRK